MSIGKFSDTIPQNRRCSSVHRENWRVCWAPSSEILTVIQTPRNLLTHFTRILSRLKASMECTRWAMFFWHFLLHSQSTPISRPWLQHRSRSSTWLWSNTACPGLQPKWLAKIENDQLPFSVTQNSVWVARHSALTSFVARTVPAAFQGNAAPGRVVALPDAGREKDNVMVKFN